MHSEPATKPQSRPGNAPAVLLVDDEHAILEAFKEALAPHYEISTASSVRQAENLLQKKAYKVVVADHRMPGGNGMNFLARCRAAFPHMQRVLVTGYVKPEILVRSVEEAALYRYLVKPVALDDLVAIVHDAARAHDASFKSCS